MKIELNDFVVNLIRQYERDFGDLLACPVDVDYERYRSLVRSSDTAAHSLAAILADKLAESSK